MKKQVMYCTALAVAFLFSTGVTNAQTKLWGVGATAGQADAEFQNNFVQASVFTAGTNPTAWTALSVSEDDGVVTPGAAYWTRNLTGLSQGAYATNMTAATSTSMSNGVALFDSDYMDNLGVAGAFGTGTSVAPHRGELISPRIDLTGATDSALLVTFYSYYRPFQLNELTVSISVDDGNTWADSKNLMTLQPTAVNAATEGQVRAMFTGATAGVANLTQCRIRFAFDGNYYYSIIDDIAIEMAPEYDLAIGLPDAAASTYFAIGDQVRVGSNMHIPLVNIDPTNLEEWLFGAKVVNNGYSHILPAANPRVHMSIDFTDDVTAQFFPAVYIDTIDAGVDSVNAEDSEGLGLVDVLRDVNFIMTNGAGRYDVTYWVAHDNMDGTPLNDTIRHSFFITDDAGGTTSHYISKVRRRASDNKPFAQTQIFPGGSPHSAFEYGSVFYIPRGMTDTIGIDSIDFRYYIPNNFSGSASQTLFVNVYNYVDGSNGGTANALVSGEELTQIGIGVASLSGLGTATAPNGSYQVGTVSNLIDAGTGGPMAALIDGGFYYVSVLTQPSLTGGPATFGFDDVPIHVVDRQNYAMNIGARTLTMPICPSTMKVVDAAGTENWYAGFTGFDEAPSIGIHLSASPLITNVTTVLNAGAEMNVYPNPTEALLNVDVTYEHPTNVQYIVTDVAGRVIYYNTSENVQSETHTLDVSNFAAGVYFITADAPTGVTTKRFVKK